MEAHPHKAINGPATVASSVCWLLISTASAIPLLARSCALVAFACLSFLRATKNPLTGGFNAMP